MLLSVMDEYGTIADYVRTKFSTGMSAVHSHQVQYVEKQDKTARQVVLVVDGLVIVVIPISAVSKLRFS